jgi:hypothetical protein
MNKKEEKRHRWIAVAISILLHGVLIVALAVSFNNNSNTETAVSNGQDENMIMLSFLMSELNDLSLPDKSVPEQKPEVASPEEVVTPPKPEVLAKKDSIEEKDTTLNEIETKELEAIQKVISQDSLIAKIFEQETIKEDDKADERQKRDADRRFARKNYRMIRNVIKVYPYAMRTKWVVDSLNMQLATMTDKKEMRELIKKTEKELFGKFEKEVRGLSVSQGKVLLKLISRETNQSAYELIKDYKGTLPAAFWQGVARLFGENLKTQYDSISEDKLLEEIIQKYNNDIESLNL